MKSYLKKKINWGIQNSWFNQYEGVFNIVLNEYIISLKIKYDWRKLKSRIWIKSLRWNKELLHWRNKPKWLNE